MFKNQKFFMSLFCVIGLGFAQVAWASEEEEFQAKAPEEQAKAPGEQAKAPVSDPVAKMLGVDHSNWSMVDDDEVDALRHAGLMLGSKMEDLHAPYDNVENIVARNEVRGQAEREEDSRVQNYFKIPLFEDRWIARRRGRVSASEIKSGKPDPETVNKARVDAVAKTFDKQYPAKSWGKILSKDETLARLDRAHKVVTLREDITNNELAAQRNAHENQPKTTLQEVPNNLMNLDMATLQQEHKVTASRDATHVSANDFVLPLHNLTGIANIYLGEDATNEILKTTENRYSSLAKDSPDLREAKKRALIRAISKVKDDAQADHDAQVKAIQARDRQVKASKILNNIESLVKEGHMETAYKKFMESFTAPNQPSGYAPAELLNEIVASQNEKLDSMQAWIKAIPQDALGGRSILIQYILKTRPEFFLKFLEVGEKLSQNNVLSTIKNFIDYIQKIQKNQNTSAASVAPKST